MKTVTLNRFDGGMTNFYRDRTPNVFKVLTNFDVLTNPNKLTPYRDSEDGDSASATNAITSFAMAKTSGTSPSDVYNLYGLGNASNKAKIYYKNLVSNLGNATWSSTSNNVSTGTTVSPDLFVHYSRANSGSAVNNSGILFGALNIGNGGTASIFGYDPTGLTAFGDDWTAVVGVGGDNCPSTIYRIAQGLVHSKDDVLYIPYDNYVASNSFATGSEVWKFPALTLPTYGFVPCICEYRNFLAVAHRPISGIGPNYVYLWGRDPSITTTDEKIYWGEEPLVFIEEIEGQLVGISLVNTYIGTSNRLIFRVFDGYSARKVLEITSSSIVIDGNKTAKQKINNRFYFTATITIDGVNRRGVWGFGKNATGQWALVLERTTSNDTVVGAGTQGFYFTGDYLFQSYSSSMSKTNDAASYTATSYAETVINPGMPKEDMSRPKQLTGVSISYENFPSGGTCVVKYRVDATTAWSSATTIISASTSGVYITEANKDNSGNEFTSGREYEFRIESTGGVEVTEFTYTYEPLQAVLPR